jgi:predicted DNA-binding WGR domain protein
MSFLRRLFGSGDQADEPSGDPEPSPTPSAPNGRPRSLGPAPKVPTLAEVPPRRLQSYFEYVGGGSAKFYAVSLEEEEGGTWRVRFNFGRIGFPRAWGTRDEGVTWAKAATAYMALVNERTGKGTS